MTEGPAEIRAEQLHNRARHAAFRDLREMYPGPFRVLYEGHLERLRRETGWVDRRPEANRESGRRRRGESS